MLAFRRGARFGFFSAFFGEKGRRGVYKDTNLNENGNDAWRGSLCFVYLCDGHEMNGGAGTGSGTGSGTSSGRCSCSFHSFYTPITNVKCHGPFKFFSLVLGYLLLMARV